MANLKLSQIAAAGSPPAPTDSLVGVAVSGPTDQRYTISQLQSAVGLKVGVSPISGGSDGKFLVDVGGVVQESDAHFPLAGGNINIYVSPTGSDSNPGTIGSPVLTGQHAINLAQAFNYEGVWQPLIHFADGTYTDVGALQIGSGWVNLFETISFTGNNVTPTNCVVPYQFELFSAGIGIGVGGFSISGCTSGSVIDLVNGDHITISGPLVFNDNNQTPFFVEGEGFVFCNEVLTCNFTTMNWFALVNPGGMWFSHATIHLPAALTINTAFFEVGGLIGNEGANVAQCILGAPTFTNFAGVTGPQLNCYGGGQMLTEHGALSDIPGTTGMGFRDETGQVAGFHDSFGIFYGRQTIGGPPTTTNVAVDGTWRIVQDMTSTNVYLAANVGGVMKILLIGGISATITTAALTVGGTQGSMTFTNGVLTAQTPAT